MASAFQTINLQNYRIAGITFDGNMRYSTRRTAWPAFTRLEPWLLAGRRARIIDFVWRLASERLVRTVLVVPIADEGEFPLELRLIFRNEKQHQDSFDGLVQAFDDGDATVSSYRSESRCDVSLLAPFLLEVRALELAALVDDEVLGFGLLDFNDSVQGRRYVRRFRPRLVVGESRPASREMILDVQQPPANRPALPKRVGNPVGPKASIDRHGRQISMPCNCPLYKPHQSTQIAGVQRTTRPIQLVGKIFEQKETEETENPHIS